LKEVDVALKSALPLLLPPKQLSVAVYRLALRDTGLIWQAP
jgi:hypothetical protein